MTNQVNDSVISLEDIPSTLLEQATQRIGNYTIGFVRVDDIPAGEDATLLGSGVLAKAGDNYVIITASHVIDVLPDKGRLGLILFNKGQKTTIDINGIHYVDIEWNKEKENEGPDIAYVVLSKSIASSLSASKSFFILDNYRSTLLSNALEIDQGFWTAQGFVDEMTREEYEPGRSRVVKGYCCFGAYGGVTNYSDDGKYDYIQYHIDGRMIVRKPADFKGMSGGGLWQIILRFDSEGKLQISKILYMGIVFYQTPFQENVSILKCHAYRSIYSIVYDNIMSGVF